MKNSNDRKEQIADISKILDDAKERGLSPRSKRRNDSANRPPWTPKPDEIEEIDRLLKSGLDEDAVLGLIQLANDLGDDEMEEYVNHQFNNDEAAVNELVEDDDFRAFARGIQRNAWRAASNECTIIDPDYHARLAWCNSEAQTKLLTAIAERRNLMTTWRPRADLKTKETH